MFLKQLNHSLFSTLPLSGGGDYVIIGDRKYHYVKIGNQLWLAENLDLKLPGIGIGGTNFLTTNPHAWYYNNDEANYGIDGTYKCGLLYNNYAVELLNNTSSIFPDGWHIPNQSEFNILFSFLTNDTAKKLKAFDGTIRSDFPSNWGGTDDYGFNFIPTGQIDGSFDRIGRYGALYTRDTIRLEDGVLYGIYNAFYNTNNEVGMNFRLERTFAISLRLVKNF